jgi:hypothetical protein
MTKTLQQILGFTCLVPCIVGLYKHKKIEQKYLPFIYMVVADFLVEAYNFLLRYIFKFKYFTELHYNIYLFISFYLFMKLAFLNNFITKKTSNILFIFWAMVAISNTILNESFTQLYRLVFVFSAIVALYIYTNILSQQILEVNTKITKNFWFWTSSFSIIYNAFLILLFNLVFFSFAKTPNGRAILNIHYYINAITYLFFAYAIYIIPEKIEFNKPIKQ